MGLKKREGFKRLVVVIRALTNENGQRVMMVLEGVKIGRAKVVR